MQNMPCTVHLKDPTPPDIGIEASMDARDWHSEDDHNFPANRP